MHVVDGALSSLPLGQRDPRLDQPPFSNHEARYIVYRHVLRASQAFKNAVEASARKRCALFVCMAADEPRESEKHLFNTTERAIALQSAGLRQTKHMSGHLPLYIGMRLLVYDKICVRLGLMNGCECILEKIVFSDDEALPGDAQPGKPIVLQYLPAQLLLRVVP